MQDFILFHHKQHPRSNFTDLGWISPVPTRFAKITKIAAVDQSPAVTIPTPSEDALPHLSPNTEGHSHQKEIEP